MGRCLRPEHEEGFKRFTNRLSRLRNKAQNSVSPSFTVIHNEIFDLPVFHHQGKTVGVHEHVFEELHIVDLIQPNDQFMLVVEGSTTLKNDSPVGESQLATNCNVIVEMAGAFFENDAFSFNQ